MLEQRAQRIRLEQKEIQKVHDEIREARLVCSLLAQKVDDTQRELSQRSSATPSDSWREVEGSRPHSGVGSGSQRGSRMESSFNGPTQLDDDQLSAGSASRLGSDANGAGGASRQGSSTGGVSANTGSVASST